MEEDKKIEEIKKEQITKQEEKKVKEKLVLPTWSIDVPLEIKRGEK
jgi:hypothetical protein